MLKRCCWKQWLLILGATGTLMAGRIAVGQPNPADEGELQQLLEQMESYGTDEGPRPSTSRERILEAQLASATERAVIAEAALATCQAEASALRSP
jgi:hypothetical protein